MIFCRNGITNLNVIDNLLYVIYFASHIQQIADELNFGDQSSFGKFFRKHTELTPREYRKSIQNRVS
jgi:AraC-like DNA-binding protein